MVPQSFIQPACTQGWIDDSQTVNEAISTQQKLVTASSKNWGPRTIGYTN
uniref:Uncharacterized protein n=1 Tax=Arundo donax TaxID=35708 RepID=A0A0A9EGC4_ARUDO